MLPYIVCLGCGYPLGDIAPLYKHIQKTRVEQELIKKNILPHNALGSANMEVKMGDVLDALCLTKMCCRIHLSTVLDYKNYY